MAEKMKIHLEADYHSYTAFYPTYRLDGRLMAVTLALHFHHESANVAIPQELVLPQLNDEQRLTLLQNKLQIAEKNLDFFQRNDIYLVIPVDEWIAQTLLSSEFLQHKFAAIPQLELELYEQFNGLNRGLSEPLLAQLSSHFRLGLGNYGAGKANSKAVFDGIFQRITLDKGFIQQQLEKPPFNPFIQVVVEHLRPYCQQLVVQGVDTPRSLATISHYKVDGISSSLFPAVGEEALETLCQTPELLHGLG